MALILMSLDDNWFHHWEIWIWKDMEVLDLSPVET